MFAESNNFIKALKQCKAAIVHKPDYDEAYFEMCNIYLAMKKYAEDNDSCKQVFNINPNYQYDSMLLDEISDYEECNRYLVVEGYAEAINSCKQAVTINPKHEGALIMLDEISNIKDWKRK